MNAESLLKQARQSLEYEQNPQRIRYLQRTIQELEAVKDGMHSHSNTQYSYKRPNQTKYCQLLHRTAHSDSFHRSPYAPVQIKSIVKRRPITVRALPFATCIGCEWEKQHAEVTEKSDSPATGSAYQLDQLEQFQNPQITGNPLESAAAVEGVVPGNSTSNPNEVDDDDDDDTVTNTTVREERAVHLEMQQTGHSEAEVRKRRSGPKKVEPCHKRGLAYHVMKRAWNSLVWATDAIATTTAPTHVRNESHRRRAHKAGHA